MLECTISFHKNVRLLRGEAPFRCQYLSIYSLHTATANIQYIYSSKCQIERNYIHWFDVDLIERVNLCN